MRLKLFSLIILVFLASCSKYKEGEVIDGEDVVPPSPPFWEYFTVEGFDEDKDGVRDDVEIWINENIKDSNIRRALKIEAGVWQKLIFVRDVGVAYKIFAKDLAVSSSCLLFTKGYLTDIEKHNLPHSSDLVFNNYWRNQEMKEFSKFIPGGVYKGADTRILHQYKACPFKINDLKKLWDFYYKAGWYKNGNIQEENEFLKLMREMR